MHLIFLLIVALLLVGILPIWPYSTGWGYFPSSSAAIVFGILLILILMEKI